MANEVTPKQGLHKVLMIRRLSKAHEESAARLALQIEHNLQYERSSEQTATKDGSVGTSGSLAVTMDIQAIISDDPLNNDIYEAFINGETLEFWEVDFTDEETPGSNKFKAKYMRGRLNSWSEPANVDTIQELSTTATIDGRPQTGYVTVAGGLVEQATYSFRDLIPVEDA